jgi:hypothetical protein
VNLPDDARPTTFLTAQLLAGGSAVAVWDSELLGVITGISGGFAGAEAVFWVLNINGIVVYGGIGFAAVGYQTVQALNPWIPVNAGDVLTWGFNSDDISAQQGFIVAGWQYNLEG